MGFSALIAAGLESMAAAVVLATSVASGASSPSNVPSVVNANLVARGCGNFALFPPFFVPNSVG